MAGKEAGLQERNNSVNSRLYHARSWQRVWAPWCVLAAFVLGWTLAAQAQQTPATTPAAKPKNIVAVVNGQAISRDQLAKECIRRFGENVLESEINKRLILQDCATQGVKITNGDIDAEIQRMADKFGLSVDRWLKMLSDERDITPAQYRRDIVWPTVALRKLAAGETRVTSTDLSQAYESEYGPAVRVRAIVANSAERANQLLQQARQNPDDFDRLAKDHSDDENSAATRGMIPPIRRHRGNEEMEKAAFALKPGQISQVIPVTGQFVILKCEQHLPAAKLDAEQKKKAVAVLRDKISNEKLRLAANNRFKKLQSKAKIVNVLNDPAKQKAMPGVAATVNGNSVAMKTLGEQCLLRHGETVLDGEINRALLKQSLKRKGLDVKQADLQREIGEAAVSFGFSDAAGKPNMNGWLKHVTEENDVTVDTYVRDAVWPSAALKKLAGTNVEVTEADLKRGFEANYGERVEILAVVLSAEKLAYEVFELARKNDSEKFFGQLAHQYSIEPVSRSNYGQVPPIRRFGGQPILEEEAFKLKPGETSSVIAMGDKFTVLRCLGRTKPVVGTIDAVREELTKDLREKKLRVAMAREFDNLRQQSKIENLLAKPAPYTGGSSLAKPVNYEAPSAARKPAAQRTAPQAPLPSR